MFRKTIFALAAVAAVGVGALASSSDAQAWKSGWHGMYPHYGWGYHGLRYGFAGIAIAPDCYQVITRRGFVRTVCE